MVITVTTVFPKGMNPVFQPRVSLVLTPSHVSICDTLQSHGRLAIVPATSSLWSPL